MIHSQSPLLTRRRRVAGPVLLAAVLATAMACGKSKSSTEPNGPAGIAGRVTQVVPDGNFRGTIRVEYDPNSSAGSPKAVVTVRSTTTILTLARAEGDFRVLSTGQWVRVWFDGPVAESYPVQGVAATVAIDSLGFGVANRVPR